MNLENYTNLDVSGMDREAAVLIYNDKVYINDCNHQCALEDALNEEEKSLELNLDEDKELDIAIYMTYNMSKHNDIATLDIYDDYNNTRYLISHFEEHLEKYWDIIEEIAINEDLILGTFTTFPSSACKIFIEQPNAEQAA